MDLSQAEKSEIALIDWDTPPLVKNSLNDEDCIINNPFDMMESKASKMDPFDLVFYETPLKKQIQYSNMLSPLWELNRSKREPKCGDMLSPLWDLKSRSRVETQCGNILSPLWGLKSRPLRKSVSLTDINGVAKMLGHVKVDKSNDDHMSLCLDQEVINQSQENCAQVLSEDCKIIENEEKKIIEDGEKKIIEYEENKIIANEGNKITKNEENKTESVLTVDINSEIDLEKDIEKHSLCSEDEKKKIREQTREKIQMLIEKAKSDYEEECSRKSLYCTPIRNFNSSLNKSESLFNRGFLQSGSHVYDDSSNKISESIACNNDSKKSNSSPVFHYSEINSFDLNSLKPEWVVDNFCDSDGSVDVQIKDKSQTTELTCNNNNDIDFKLKALNNRIGIIESKQNACHILKSTQNKKPQNKGPFLANIPLQQMVQNYEEEETKEIIHAPISPRRQIKPVASSTPTTDIVAACNTPSTIESSIKSRPSISRRSISSVDSLNTPMNVTKCFGKNATCDVDRNKFPLKNGSHSASSKKRSNTTIVLCGEANERKLKMVETSENTSNLIKSKSLSKIGKIPKPMTSSTNRMSGLPVPKRFSNSVSIPLKGKENMKPQ